MVSKAYIVLSLLAAAATVCIPEKKIASHKGYISPRDKQEMELSTFYSDCSVYEDPNLFGGEICGNDGNTYANVVYLSCLNHWEPENQKVDVKHRGPCMNEKPPFVFCPVYKPICGSDNKTYANFEALTCKNGLLNTSLIVQYPGECLHVLGHSGFDESPVCCSNGRTYANVEQVRKLRKFGSSLDILHDGGCTIEEVKNRITKREELCDLARNYYENNPVCGEDNITYPNPYVMLCYKPHINAVYMGECNSPRHRACIFADKIDKGLLTSTQVVCGSDGLTYPSLYHLECAKHHDKHLHEIHDGPCQREDSPCLTMPILIDEGSPVCGSDGVTYVNPYALWCVQRRQDPYLRYVHDGVCLRKCSECL